MERAFIGQARCRSSPLPSATQYVSAAARFARRSGQSGQSGHAGHRAPGGSPPATGTNRFQGKSQLGLMCGNKIDAREVAVSTIGIDGSELALAWLAVTGRLMYWTLEVDVRDGPNVAPPCHFRVDNSWSPLPTTSGAATLPTVK